MNTAKPANLTLQQITDGSSNTLMVGERDGYHSFAATWPAALQLGGSVQTITGSTGSFEGRPGEGLDSVYQVGGAFPPIASDVPANYDARLEWCSMHPGMVGFVFADASVHFLSKSLDADQIGRAHV